MTRTPEKDAAFFAALSEGRPVGAAARAAGYTRAEVVAHRAADPVFATNWRDADDEAVERMEAEADRRAVDGVVRKMFYQGQECGEIRDYSDSLLVLRLKAKRPDLYRDRHAEAQSAAEPLTVVIKQF